MEPDAALVGSAPPPAGTVAFLYTDIEASSRLHEGFPERMALWHRAHDRLIERVVSDCDGTVFRHTGDGYCAAFPTVDGALGAAMAAQRALGGEVWDDELRARVRMAVFAGPVERHEGQYAGRTLSRGSRLLNAAHGGQTLLSAAAIVLLADVPAEVQLRELGRYVLQGGVDREETIHQAVPRGFPGDFPPLVRHKGAVSTEPEPASWDDAPRPFFGREEDLRVLRRTLARPGHRLVTITGLGGMGKSRLAREILRQAEARFPDGRSLVRCEAIRSSEEAMAALAAAMALPTSGGDPERSVAAALRGQKALVVFDGFEGLTAHAGALERLLAATGTIKILVTSRWPLGLEREVEYPLGPLDAATEARLFADAASHSNPRFRSAKTDAVLVERICRRLEGVPLAIMIAAGCLKWCDLAALERIVQTDLLDIEGPSGTRASLRSVIDASVGALAPDDRDFLLRLALFGGAFEIDDVRAVLDVDRPTAIRRLASLRDYALVHVSSAHEGPSFRLLGSVRETIRRRIEAEGTPAPTSADRGRHLASARARAARIGEAMASGRRTEGTADFLRSLADLREAMERAAEEEDEASIRALAWHLARMALETGLGADFDRWVGLSSPRAEAVGDWPLAMRLLGLQGARAQRAGDLSGAREIWSARLALAERIGEAFVVADAEFDLANVAWASGDGDATVIHLARAERVAREIGNDDLIALVLSLDAILARERGDTERARRNAETALALGAAREAQHAFFFVSHKCGNVLRGLGDDRGAEAVHLRMLRAATAGQDVHNAAWAFLELARLYLGMGDEARAATALQGGHAVLALTGARLRTEMEWETGRLVAAWPPHDRPGLRKRLAATDWRVPAARLIA